MRSGRAEQLIYALSRWTDLPAAKWPWFEQQLQRGWMIGFDPRNGIPAKWSLAVGDVLGLVFWTRNPRNLIANAEWLKSYPLAVHFTLTGWHEVEPGAPGIEEGLVLLRDTVRAFGPDRVTWRFSPVPMVADVLDRFEKIAREAAQVGLPEVFAMFLQDNDLMPETRPPQSKIELLRQMALRSRGLHIRLCQDDATLDIEGQMSNLARGVCESGKRFAAGARLDKQSCGCALAVDPFTINESCSMGCAYCYAADRSLASSKRDTTTA